MAITYDKKIDIKTDWGGDKSTNYIPVAGRRVQEVIKDELGKKIGAFYKPEGGNKIYCFASVEDKNEYLQTLDESLIVDRLETESLYEVEFNIDTLVKEKYILDSNTGNTIYFQFKITDKDGWSVDSTATIEYRFTNAETTQSYTERVDVNSNGWTSVTSGVIDEYLKLGANQIMVIVTGNNTKAYKQISLTYRIFQLSYVPVFKYNIAQSSNVLAIPFTVQSSAIPVKIKNYVDGVENTSSEMVVYEYNKEGVLNIPISNLSPGRHTLQTRAYVETVDGGVFQSNLYYYAFAVAGEAAPALLLEKAFDDEKPVIENDGMLTVDVEQFEEFSINWSLYSITNRRFTVTFEFDGNVISNSVIDGNGVNNEFSFKPLTHGQNKLLRIYSVDNESGDILFEDGIVFNIRESETGLKETTENMLLKLTANGRRNTDADYNKWSCIGSDYVEYKATFNGFAWNKQQGWNEDEEALIISDNAYVDFNIQPMVNHWELNGGTLEIDLETFDVENDDAVICECKVPSLDPDYKQAFISITATKAEFSTKSGTKINTRYKDNERLKIAFIGNKIGPNEDHNMIYIMVNGVLERAAMYPAGDTIASDAFLRIGTGNGGCKVKLHSIRIYERAITVDEEFNNFVIDSPNSQIIYEKNDVIVGNGSTKIDFNKIANKLPVMIFTGDMEQLMEEGQATKPDGVWYKFDVEYINRKDPKRNFVGFNCQMKLQGTSSLGYPRKNFKLKTKNKDFSNTAEVNYYLDKYAVDTENSSEGNKRLLNIKTGQLLEFGELETGCLLYDYQNKPLHKGRYKFRENSHNATKWTLKADFMESSCSHNVSVGRSWNDIFENVELTTGKGYSNNTYRKEEMNLTGVNQDGYLTYRKGDVDYEIPYNTLGMKNQDVNVCRTEAQKICHATENAEDVRTAVDGFPMVCFYRRWHSDSIEDWVFMGQYNFINDKGSYEVFGFEDIEDPNYEGDGEKMIFDGSNVECWEGLSNKNAISMFMTVDNWYDTKSGYSSTYEARYPDPEDVDVDSSALYELSKWIVSTRHEEDTVYGENQIYIDSSFATRINHYQYGYNDDTKSGYTYIASGYYPDTEYYRQKKFEVEKWEHFDMWKVAGYYIYLMRYGAVDQFVKNTMLFTDGNGKFEDNSRKNDIKYRKWYFLNYDNDCVFGLRNNGNLAFHWDIDRQTIDQLNDYVEDENNNEEGSNTYAMMGHDSTLWNNLERDEEFMRMVYDLDNSMNRFGLNYDNIVKEFDTNQTEQWCERIYNANERYKYIQAAKATGDMSGKTPVDNLWMLQGTRRSHRHWWVANRFDYLDAKWLSGDYKNDYVLLKFETNNPYTIRGVAGCDYYFAYGTQKAIIDSNMIRKEGEEIEYVFNSSSQGDPILIYAPYKLETLDTSSAARYVWEGSFEFKLNGTNVANRLKKLIVGNPNVVVNAAVSLSTWSNLKNLEYLDITNFKSISDFDYSSFNRLNTFKAFGTTLFNFAPAAGSKFELVELPGTITDITMDDINFTSFDDGFNYTPTQLLEHVYLDNSQGISNMYFIKLIKPWIEKIESTAEPASYYRNCSLKVKHVNWSFNEINSDTGATWLDLLEKLKNGVAQDAINPNFDLSGVIDLRSCGALKSSDIVRLKNVFGDDCFNESSGHIFIMTPQSIFIQTDRYSMVAGDTNIFTREIYPDEKSISGLGATIRYYLVKRDDNGQYIDYANGGVKYSLLTEEEIKNLRPIGGVATSIYCTNKFDENGKQIFELATEEIKKMYSTPVKVMACLIIGNTNKISVCDFTILDPTYAINGSILGNKSLKANSTYSYTMSLSADTIGNPPIGSETVTWTVDCDDYDTYIDNVSVSENTLVLTITTTGNQPETSEEIWIRAHVEHGNGGSFDREFKALILNDQVIMTVETNPVVMDVCNSRNWTQHSDLVMLKNDAEAINSEEFADAFSNLTANTFTFNELMYFTGLTELPAGAFKNSKIKEVTLPKTITSVGDSVFENCTVLDKVNTVVTRTIDGVTSDVVEENTLDNITEVSEKMFLNCDKIKRLVLGDSITTIKNYAFGGTSFTKALLGVEKLGENVLILPKQVVVIQGNAFEIGPWSITDTTNKLTVIELPLTLKLTEDDGNGFKILYGKKYVEYLTEEPEDGSLSFYKSIDGVLYNGMLDELIKYPAKKEKRNEYEVYSLYDLLDNSGISISTLSAYSFLFVENLDEVITTKSVIGIGEHLFDYSNIKSINLRQSDSLTYISRYAFNNCQSLRSILLPPSINTVMIRAFINCPMLEELILPNNITTFETITGPNGIVTSEMFSNLGISELHIPNNITGFGYNLITNCPNITEISFPEKMAFGGRNSTYSYFSNCPSLVKIVLPVSSYYDNVYYEIGDSDGNPSGIIFNTEVEANTYVSENGGTIIFHGDDVVVNELFGGDTANIIDGDGAQSLVEYEFPSINNGLHCYINDGCIYHTNNKILKVPFGKTSVSIPETIVAIERRCFEKCRSLVNITLPNGLTTIGQEAFQFCTSLEEIKIPTGVTIIDYSLFNGDSALQTLYLAGNVTSIGNIAFGGCSNLRNIYIFSEVAPSLGFSDITYSQTFVNNGVYAGYNTKSLGNSLYVIHNAYGYETDANKHRVIPEEGPSRDFATLEEANEYIAEHGGTYKYLGDGTPSWVDPAQNPDKCGYVKKSIKLVGPLYIKVYVNNVEYNSEYVYVTSANGEIGPTGQEYSAGHFDSEIGKYIVPVNNLYHGESLTVYSDIELTEEIGTLTVDFFEEEYQIGEPAAILGKGVSSSRGLKSGMFSSTVLGSTDENTENNETVTISKNEYDTIISNLNYLNGMIKSFCKK